MADRAVTFPQMLLFFPGCHRYLGANGANGANAKQQWRRYLLSFQCFCSQDPDRAVLYPALAACSL